MITGNSKIARCLLFIILFLAPSVFAQNPFLTKKEIPTDSLMKIARMIVDSSGPCILVTVDEDNKPHARIMDPFAPDENMTVWMGTVPGSRKVKHIRANPNVVLLYFDKQGLSYVELDSKAELVDDAASKEKYFKPYWSRYYPDRNKDMILIHVVPEKMEVVSYKHQFFWTEGTFEPSQTVDFTSGKTVRTKTN